VWDDLPNCFLQRSRTRGRQGLEARISPTTLPSQKLTIDPTLGCLFEIDAAEAGEEDSLSLSLLAVVMGRARHDLRGGGRTDTLFLRFHTLSRPFYQHTTSRARRGSIAGVLAAVRVLALASTDLSNCIL
jgi:hypothetical protein